MTIPQVLSLIDFSTTCRPSLSSLYLFCNKTKCLRSFIIPQASSSSSSSSCWCWSSLSRRQLITHTATLLSSSNFLQSSSSKALATLLEDEEKEEEEEEEEVLCEWERVYFPINPDVVLVVHPNHGADGLLGSRLTILETRDRGSTLVRRSIPSAELKDFSYRFNFSSFKGKERWIVGKPAILLYTMDTGANWKLIPLSSQLPGDMHYHGDRSKSGSKEERPRFFDSNQKSLCWAKAATVPGRHPDRWRKDAAGNVVCRRFHNCQGCLCYEYDHIIPFSKGGPSMAENCQILQTRVNRFKSDKDDVKMTQLKRYSCDLHFSEKELDIIEMAVYGNVLRPGNQCRVGTVEEMHGTYKSRDQMRACKLP